MTPEQREELDEMAADNPYLQFALGEIDRLNGIVAKLPKTADGVPVVPGMKLWHCPDYETPSCVALTGLYCMGAKCYSPPCQSDGSSGVHIPFCNAYSTRAAAAEAAKAGAAR